MIAAIPFLVIAGVKILGGIGEPPWSTADQVVAEAVEAIRRDCIDSWQQKVFRCKEFFFTLLNTQTLLLQFCPLRGRHARQILPVVDRFDFDG